jgi:RNA methyltransferase, TrmH family
MDVKQISSLQNPLVKEVVKLGGKSSERRKTGCFVIEGRREVSLAIHAGYSLKDLIVCPALYIPDPHYPVLIEKYQEITKDVSENVYSKIAYRGNAEGIMAVAEYSGIDLQYIKLKSTPLIIVLESVEKPGNLGAILRTADAAGVDAVVICDPSTDIYNPNIIRSSLGCVFTVQTAVCSIDEWFHWASAAGIKTMLASVQSEKHYFNADLSQPVALVFGTEADGLSPMWYQKANEKLKIPMAGKIDSLNVAASAAIMIFDAVRQRNS